MSIFPDIQLFGAGSLKRRDEIGTDAVMAQYLVLTSLVEILIWNADKNIFLIMRLLMGIILYINYSTLLVIYAPDMMKSSIKADIVYILLFASLHCQYGIDESSASIAEQDVCEECHAFL